MLVYIIPFIILLVSSFNEVFSKRIVKKNPLLFITIIYLIIIAGIRYGMGIDYFAYKDIFFDVNKLSDYKYLEFGFRLLIVIFKNLGLPSQSLFLVFSFLTLFLLFHVIKKKSYHPMLSLFIYLCIFYATYVFNGMRQAIVMSIFLASIESMEKHKTWKVLLFTFVGVSIHSAGIFILFSYLISNRIFNRKKYMYMLLISIITIFLNTIYANTLISMMPEFIRLRLISYVSTYKDSVDLMGLLQRLAIILPFLLYYPMLKRIDTKFERLFNIYFFGYMLYALFSFQGLFATRINMFFRILEILLIPYFFKLEIRKFDKFVIFSFITLWGGILYFSVLRSSYYYPYISLFDKNY